MPGRADVLSVVESAYRVEATEDEWLRGVLEAIGPHLDMGMGVGCYPYDASNTAAFSIGDVSGWRLSDQDVIAVNAKKTAAIIPPAYVERTYRSRLVGLSTDFLDTPEDLAVFNQIFPPLGIADTLSVNASDPGGRGFLFWAHSRVPVMLGARRTRLARLAAHLASGRRLRNRLAATASERGVVTGGAEAVLTPGGRVDHAEGEAVERGAREALRAAVERLEAARGPLRRRDPVGALRLWTALASGRWSLVDHFESGGRRLLVAQRNEARTPAIATLAARERLAVGFARQGLSNKLIAYQMGVAASTVGVLLHRAARKLGVANRAALIEAYKAAERAPNREE